MPPTPEEIGAEYGPGPFEPVVMVWIETIQARNREEIPNEFERSALRAEEMFDRQENERIDALLDEVKELEEIWDRIPDAEVPND